MISEVAPRIRENAASGLTADCKLNNDAARELLNQWSQKFDLLDALSHREFRLQEGYLSTNGEGVLYVGHHQGKEGKDNYYWVGIIRKNDYLNPSLVFEAQLQSDGPNSVDRFISKLRQQQGMEKILTHPLQRRVASVHVPADLERAASHYYDITDKSRPADTMPLM